MSLPLFRHSKQLFTTHEHQKPELCGKCKNTKRGLRRFVLITVYSFVDVKPQYFSKCFTLRQKISSGQKRISNQF